MKKRIFSLALALVLFLAAIPSIAPVFAKYEDWYHYTTGDTMRLYLDHVEPQDGTYAELLKEDYLFRHMAPYMVHPDYPNADHHRYFSYYKGIGGNAVTYENRGFPYSVPLIILTDPTNVEYTAAIPGEKKVFESGTTAIYVLLRGVETVDGRQTVHADYIVINYESYFMGADPDLASVTKAQTISAGSNHTLGIQTDGSLWAWGSNEYGELSDKAGGKTSKPMKIMDDVSAVSASEYISMAVKNDDSLWSWGWNAHGQLGDGTTSSRSAPKKIMDDVAAVSAGVGHSLAVDSNGSLWGWGHNGYGQMGDGAVANRLSPVKIMDGVVSAAAGYAHSLALKNDGTVWAWGMNDRGQVGDGTTTDRRQPVKVLDGIAAVYTQNNHSLAVGLDGTLWAWGWNENGQLGDGTTTNRNKPTKVLTGVATASAGGSHTLALRIDGSLWAWGNNDRRELGDGTSSDRLKPVLVEEDVLAVDCGQRHTIAVKTDGHLYGWGNNEYGQVGNGTSTSNITSHVKVLENILSDDNATTPEPLPPVEPTPPTPGDKPSDWAAGDVNRAISAGIVPPELQSSYTADITRAEFCALAVGIYEAYTGKEITERVTLTDTNDVNVQKMAALGIVTPYGDGAFNPDGIFNRQMAARLMVNLLNALEINLPKTPTTFPDKASIASWALESVGQVQAAGLMGGTGDGTFNPGGKFTRQAGILVMLNVWDYLQAL